MKVWTKKGEINLGKTHFVAAGGEGQVFAKDGIAYKIYTDPSKMIPTGKIQELATISEPNVIKPLEIITDQKKHPVGYSMRFIKDTFALCQLFTRAFRDREQLDHNIMLKLIEQLRAMVMSIHKASVLVVDLNEMNFLVDQKFQDVFAIDVDSYQTRSFPATALMESVRDRHTNGFSELTDWFAFGIVSFQMFIGIHPYKGKHPGLKTLDERMMKNVSVLNRDVTVPRVCYPFDVIPDAYMAWYKAIFEEGKRLPPPDHAGAAVYVVPMVKHMRGTNQFDIQELFDVEGTIVEVFFDLGNRAILTDKKFYLGNMELDISSNPRIGVIAQTGHVVLGHVENKSLRLFDAPNKGLIPCGLAGSALMSYDGRFYVKQSDSILELDFTELGKNILVSSKVVANILENASQVFAGVVVQNLLGAHYVSVFPKPGVHQQVKMPELDDYRVIDAKFDHGVLMVVGVRTQGRHAYYDRIVFRFEKDYSSYDIRKIENITFSGLNFVTLDNGICVSLNEDDEIELFSNRKGSQNIKTVKDPVLGNDMRLFRNGASLMFARGNKLYSIKMK
jgi:hypothetical protein